MGNIVELRKLVKNVLNTNCLDPYDPGSTRIGNQFIDEVDGINLDRANSFPKAFLKTGPTTSPVKDNIGKTGHVKKYGTVDIFYYSKEKNNYTDGETTYKNQDVVSFMLNEIQTTLLNNAVGSDYHLHPSSFSESGDIVSERPVSSAFKVYRGAMSVTYYWDEIYGSN